MSSMLRWIWESLKRIAAALYGLAGNISTWIIGGLASVATMLVGSIGDLFKAALPELEWPDLYQGSGDLFSGLVYCLALDEALPSLAVVLGIWVAARLARLALIPIRGLLEVL